MFHIALDDFDEVGNQIIAPSQLHIDLGECVFNAITSVDQSVVNANCPEDNCRNKAEENQ